jgi:hypothetical protein
MSEIREEPSGPATATLVELPEPVYEYLEGTGWGQGEFDGDDELRQAHACLHSTAENKFKVTPPALRVFREYVETLVSIGDEDERTAAERFMRDTQPSR